jgi:type I restriction enzyme R subunit
VQLREAIESFERTKGVVAVVTPNDKLVYVNDVIEGKLMESDKLAEQATNNTKEQFAASPDLANEIMNAVMDALTAHSAMSKQALESEQLRNDMKDVLLGAGQLWEGLRGKGLGGIPG